MAYGRPMRAPPMTKRRPPHHGPPSNPPPIFVLPGQAPVSFSGLALTIVSSDHRVVNPDRASAALVGWSPTVIALGSKTASPDTVAALVVGRTPQPFVTIVAMASLTGPSTCLEQELITYTVTLNAAATQSYTVFPICVGATVVPSSATISVGQTSTSFSVTPPSSGSYTVDFTISPSIIRAGRPIALAVGEPTWITDPLPATTFTFGTPGDYSLIQHVQYFNPLAHKFELASGSLPAGLSIVAASGLHFTGEGSTPTSIGLSYHIGNISGLVFKTVQNASSVFTGRDPVAVVSSSSTTADADFAARRTAPGVFAYIDFSSAGDIGGGYGAWRGYVQGSGGNSAPIIDNVVKCTSGGSMRMDIVPQTGGSTNWWTNFSQDLSRQFGAGDTFYYQFRYRVSPEVAALYGPKIFLCGTGDTPGNFVSSCTDLEIELNTYGYGSGAWLDMYNACPGSCGAASIFEFAEPFGSFDYKKQNALDNGAGLPDAQRYCLYSNPSLGCIQIYDHPNEWFTIQVGVTLGALQTIGGHDWFYESNVKCWIQVGLGPEKLVWDWTGGVTPGNTHTSSPPCHGLCAGNTPGSGQKYGKLWLLPYNQSLGAGAVAGSVWYDDLILSTQKIPAVTA